MNGLGSTALVVLLQNCHLISYHDMQCAILLDAEASRACHLCLTGMYVDRRELGKLLSFLISVARNLLSLSVCYTTQFLEPLRVNGRHFGEAPPNTSRYPSQHPARDTSNEIILCSVVARLGIHKNILRALCIAGLVHRKQSHASISEPRM